jgi:hypothetical protein
MTLRNEDGKKLNDYPLDLNVVGKRQDSGAHRG